MTSRDSAVLTALDDLADGAKRLGIELDARALERFSVYCEMLLASNAQFNLTAMRTAEAAMRQLFLDSLSIVPRLPEGIRSNESSCRAMDVGTGAGVPGLPLQIAFPHWTSALVESTGKKARFVEMIAQKLGLQSVTVLHERAESVGAALEWREQADICTARAVAPLVTLLELCAPLIRVGGVLVFPKSGELSAEVAAAMPAMRVLGIGQPAVYPVPDDLGLGTERKIVIFSKETATPPAYPRRIGLARSQPIGFPKD